jgi:hypothetical protein
VNVKRNVRRIEEHPLKRAHMLFFAVLLLTAAASFAGLIYPETLYPSEEIRRSFFSNDIITILIGATLCSLWTFCARGREPEISGGNT